jgi:outer membrane receptor protein involved in Fe transport
MQVDYSMPLNFSMMGAGRSRASFFFLATRTLDANVTPLADLPDDIIKCKGKFGVDCGDPTPKWKWSSRLSLQDGPLTASLRWRHLGKARDDDDSTDYAVERIRSYNLFDLGFAFDVNDNFSMNVGVNNLLDKDPPVLGFNSEQANTYPGSYQVLGRDYYVSTRLRF